VSKARWLAYDTFFFGGNLNVIDFHHQTRFEIWNQTVYMCTFGISSNGKSSSAYTEFFVAEFFWGG
jgi:hypothetical protein